MNEEELDLDMPFAAPDEEPELTPEPATPQYATREEIAELKELLLAGQQAAAPAPSAPADDDDDEFTFVTKKDFKQLVQGVTSIIAPMQEQVELASRSAITTANGIDDETFASLTAGMSPSDIREYVKMPAFKNAAKLAAAGKQDRITAPRARNTNGAPATENDTTMNNFLKALTGEIRF